MRGVMRLGTVLFLLAGLFSLEVRVGAAEKVPGFRASYQREAAELKAELEALEGELKILKGRNKRRERILEGTIQKLFRSLDRTRKQAGRLEEQVRSAGTRLHFVEDRGELVDSALNLAAHTLRKEGVAVSAAGKRTAALERIYARGIALARKLSGVYREKGKFFGLKGLEMVGTIVHVGKVAALGVAPGGGGLLRRLPGGGYKVVDATRLADARRLARGESLKTTPVFFHDPLTRTHHGQKKRGLIETTRAGGLIAWIILALAAFGLLLILERCLTLIVVSNRSSKLAARLRTRVEAGDLEGARALVRGRGALARVLAVVLKNHGQPREKLENLATESVLKELPRLERLLPLLNAVAAVAPLLGLLGTVTGMIATFEVITEYGTGDPKLLSGGISEALITTEFGLAVAIPVLLAHSLLARWADNIIEAMQTHTLSLINLLTGKAPMASRKDADGLSDDGGGSSREADAPSVGQGGRP